MQYWSAIHASIANDPLTDHEHERVREVESFEEIEGDPFDSEHSVDFINACIAYQENELLTLRRWTSSVLGRLELLKYARQTKQMTNPHSRPHVSDSALLHAAEKLFAEFCDRQMKPEYTEITSDLEYLLGIPATEIEQRLTRLESAED